MYYFWNVNKDISTLLYSLQLSILFFHYFGVRSQYFCSATVVCSRRHTSKNNMSSLPTVNTNKSVCSKSGRPPFQPRYPPVECSQCSRLFHKICLIKSYACRKQYLSYAYCKKKCMIASMRESQKSRQSSGKTSTTNVRRSARSGVAISASRQGGEYTTDYKGPGPNNIFGHGCTTS